MGKNTATYWVHRIDELKHGLATCAAEYRLDYQRDIRYAQKKLMQIRRRAGIYI